MVLVEYMRHKVQGGITTPPWIINGGHWLSPVDDSLVGWIEEEADRRYYVPDTLTILTRSDLITRALGCHAVQPFMKGLDTDSPSSMTTAEVEALVGDWYDNS